MSRRHLPHPPHTLHPLNPRLHGTPLNVRLVAYKKHKRPDQFNYWITGLQALLKQLGDVRVTAVRWDTARQVFVIHLAAAVQQVGGLWVLPG